MHGGVVWLEAVGPGSAQEPVPAEALGRWVPDRVVIPVAVDRARRLMLLPDGGPTLRATGPGDPAAWEAVLRRHTRLQIAVAPHAEAMVALGSPTAGRDGCPGRPPN